MMLMTMMMKVMTGRSQNKNHYHTEQEDAHVPPCQIHQWVLPSHLIPSQDLLLVEVLARA